MTAKTLASELYRCDRDRDDVCPDGVLAFGRWVRAAREVGDRETLDALEAVDQYEFTSEWDALVAADTDEAQWFEDRF